MENLSNSPASQAGGVGSSSTTSSSQQLNNGAKVPDDYVDPEDVRWAANCKVRDESKEWARKLRMHEDDIRVFMDNGYSPEGLLQHHPNSRRGMLAYLKKRSGPIPRWVALSGLWNETDKTVTITEESRRKRLKTLYKVALLLIKRALGRHEVDPDKADRSVFWDPVAMVARELDIPPSKLSALLKEHCGHSLTQVIDNVRAERLKGKLRAGIRGFLLGRGRGVESAVTPHPASGTAARRPCYVTRLQAKSRNKSAEVVDRAACYSVVFRWEKTCFPER